MSLRRFRVVGRGKTFSSLTHSKRFRLARKRNERFFYFFVFFCFLFFIIIFKPFRRMKSIHPSRTGASIRCMVVVSVAAYKVDRVTFSETFMVIQLFILIITTIRAAIRNLFTSSLSKYRITFTLARRCSLYLSSLELYPFPSSMKIKMT